MTQLRVLLVLDYSGASYSALWQAVAALDVDLHIVATLDAPIAPGIPFVPEPPTVGTFHALSPRKMRGDHPLWWQYKGLASVIDQVRPNLLHLKTEPWSLITGQALRANRPTVVHGVETRYEQGGTVQREARHFLARRNLRRLHGFVGWSTAAIGAARCCGLPTTTPVLVAPAETPDPELFRVAAMARDVTRKELEFGDDFVVGFVGRYVPEKGLAWLLQAFEQAAPVGAQLACFGCGPDVSLIQAASDRTAGRVRDFGPVALETAGRAIAGIDVLVVPSTSAPAWAEQFGRVAVEGMLAGVPVIASRSGALPEVIGGSGLLVDELDVQGLWAAIDRLRQDRDLRLGLGEAGRRHAITMFDPRNLAERLIAYWRRVASKVTDE